MAASSSVTSACPALTAGTTGVAGAAGAASSARASDLTASAGGTRSAADQVGRHRGAEEEERGNYYLGRTVGAAAADVGAAAADASLAAAIDDSG